MVVTIITILCAIVLVCFFLLLPGASDSEQRAPFWGRNIAHRGLHTRDQTVPENSIAAFTAALDGEYGIELDVRLTADGEVVVFHDDTLQRVCGAPGRVDETDFADLRALPLFGTDQRVPLLREVLELVDEREPLVIELKTAKDYGDLCERTWRILRLYDGDICVESFDPRILRWFKKNAPGLLRGQLSALPKRLNRGAAGYAVGWLLANFLGRPHFIAYEKGLRPVTVRLVERFAMRAVWTVGPDDAHAIIEDENDMVIFEYYEPDPWYKEMPDISPPDDEYRF